MCIVPTQEQENCTVNKRMSHKVAPRNSLCESRSSARLWNQERCRLGSLHRQPSLVLLTFCCGTKSAISVEESGERATSKNFPKVFLALGRLSILLFSFFTLIKERLLMNSLHVVNQFLFPFFLLIPSFLHLLPLPFCPPHLELATSSPDGFHLQTCMVICPTCFLQRFLGSLAVFFRGSWVLLLDHLLFL